jgi:hypothetical protein
MKDQPITVEDYKEHSQEFFDKYFYVAKELGEGAKAERQKTSLKLWSLLLLLL